jgi:hypothetical protein
MALGTTKPYRPPELPAGTINTTDPDSRLVKTVGQRALQGYNAQAAVNERQIVVAAEVTLESPDFGHLEPMVDAAQRELERAGAQAPQPPDSRRRELNQHQAATLPPERPDGARDSAPALPDSHTRKMA